MSSDLSKPLVLNRLSTAASSSFGKFSAGVLTSHLKHAAPSQQHQHPLSTKPTQPKKKPTTLISPKMTDTASRPKITSPFGFLHRQSMDSSKPSPNNYTSNNNTNRNEKLSQNRVKTPSSGNGFVRTPSLKYQRPTTARNKTGAKTNVFFITKDQRKDS